MDEPERTAEEEPTYRETPSQSAVRHITQSTREASSDAGKPKGNKRRLHDLSAVVNELRTTSQVLSESEPRMEETEAFGNYVASALDKFPRKEAILAQSEIQQILTRYSLNILEVFLTD